MKSFKKIFRVFFVKFFSKILLFSISIFFVSCSISNAQVSSGVDLRFSSSDIASKSSFANDFVFKGFGCEGKNLSPQISWQGIPAKTKSLALTVFDVDAPTGSGWWHWLIFNIPTTYNELKQGFSMNSFNLTDGINQAKNDYSEYGYGGPCPPKGDKKHRYIFTLYALDVEKIDVKQDASPALVSFMIRQHVIRKSTFEAFYQR